jgi:hypothetical protein
MLCVLFNPATKRSSASAQSKIVMIVIMPNPGGPLNAPAAPEPIPKMLCSVPLRSMYVDRNHTAAIARFRSRPSGMQLSTSGVKRIIEGVGGTITT